MYTTTNSVENSDGTTGTVTTELRQATIPASIKVNPSSYDNISIFKFVIYLDGYKHMETLLTLNCLEAS